MRRPVQFLFTGLVVILFGCNQKNAEKAPVLSTEEMVPVIYDLMLSEEYARQQVVKDSLLKLDDLSTQKYDQVFLLHKTSRKDFSDSYTYYLGHPDKFKAIYDSVNATASRRRLEIMNPAFRGRDKTERKPLQLNRDSIK